MTRLSVMRTQPKYDPVQHVRTNFGDRWLYRWRFDFHHRPTKFGSWQGSSNRMEDLASYVNKDGLAFARVEGKHFLTREIRIFAECAGWDFINFEFLACLISNDKSSLNFVYGLRLRSDKSLTTCLADGSTRIEQFTPDKNFVFPEWTKN